MNERKECERFGLILVGCVLRSVVFGKIRKSRRILSISAAISNFIFTFLEELFTGIGEDFDMMKYLQQLNFTLLEV